MGVAPNVYLTLQTRMLCWSDPGHAYIRLCVVTFRFRFFFFFFLTATFSFKVVTMGGAGRP